MCHWPRADSSYLLGPELDLEGSQNFKFSYGLPSHHDGNLSKKVKYNKPTLFNSLFLLSSAL